MPNETLWAAIGGTLTAILGAIMVLLRLRRNGQEPGSKAIEVKLSQDDRDILKRLEFQAELHNKSSEELERKLDKIIEHQTVEKGRWQRGQ